MANEETSAPYNRAPVAFEVEGSAVRGELLRPRGVERAPVVLMAHGFAAERRYGLMPFADRFARAGLAVLLFDHRAFGESDGEVRHLVSPPRHLADWAAAFAFAQRTEGLDRARVALWGTSFAGGHALVTAARTPEVAAVVAQVPHVDGLASALAYPPRKLPAAMGLALSDKLAALRGRPPVRIAVVAAQGPAALAADDCWPGYRALVPEGEPVPEVPARILLDVMAYRPTTEVSKIRAPTLIIAATGDTLIPIAAVRRAARKIPGARLTELTLGHFDIYAGPPFEQVVADETAFLCQALGVAQKV